MSDRYLHLVTAGEWEASVAAGVHEPASLATQGFIHLSTPAQVAATVARHYPDVADLLVVEVDPERVRAEVVFEEGEPGEWFPHLFGPLELDAVVDVRPWSEPASTG